MDASLLRCLGVFGVIGPPLGFIFANMLSAVVAKLTTLAPVALGGALMDSLALAVVAWPGTLLVGGLPALATSVLYWLWRRRVTRPRLWEAAAQAAVMSVVACAAFAV